MHRFREQWLALFGGILLVTLSVSSVVGAPPADTDGNRGQSISAFVHGLVFGDDVLDEATDAAAPEDEAQTDGEVDGSAHGACVSEVARDREAVGGPNDNHGGAVSEAARVTCWEDEAAEEEAPPEEEAVEEEATESANAHGTCVSEVARDKAAVGGMNQNHGGAVSEAARVTCREGAEPDAEDGPATDDTDAEAAAANPDPSSTDKADRPGKGNGRDHADRAKGGRGHGRGHR